MKKQSQSTFGRFVKSKFFLLILLLAVFFVFFSYGKTYYQNYKIAKEINNLREQIDKMEKNKFESVEILQYVMSEKFIEDSARTELNMKKPGEKVVFVKELLDKDNVRENNQKKDEEGINDNIVYLKNPLKWWFYFTAGKF